MPSIIDLLVQKLKVRKGSRLGDLLGDLGSQEFSNKLDNWKNLNDKIEYCSKMNKHLDSRNQLYDQIINRFGDKSDIYVENMIKLNDNIIKSYCTKKRDSTFIIVKVGNEEIISKCHQFLIVDNVPHVAYEPLCKFNQFFYGKIKSSELGTNPVFFTKIQNILDSVVMISSGRMKFTYFVPLQSHEAATRNGEKFEMDENLFKNTAISDENLKELMDKDSNWVIPKKKK